MRTQSRVSLDLFTNYKFIVHNYFHQFLVGHDKDALKHITNVIDDLFNSDGAWCNPL